MESSLISGSGVATIATAPDGQDVRKRWLLLAAALVLGLVAAFAIGSAVKKSSAPTVPTPSLAQSSPASGQHASITPLTNAGAVPALHAPPVKHKPKTTPTNTTPASSSSSSVASTSVSSGSTPSSGVTQSSAPTVSSTPTQSSGGGGGGGGSTSGGTTGVSHGGGGG